MPFSPPRDLSNPGIKPAFPALAVRFFTTEKPGKPKNLVRMVLTEFSVSIKKKVEKNVIDLQLMLYTCMTF